MTEEALQLKTREAISLLKKLGAAVPPTSNAIAYNRYLEDFLHKGATFDRDSDRYVDYVARTLQRKGRKSREEAPSVPEKGKKRDEASPKKEEAAQKSEGKKRRRAADDDEGKKHKKHKKDSV